MSISLVFLVHANCAVFFSEHSERNSTTYIMYYMFPFVSLFLSLYTLSRSRVSESVSEYQRIWFALISLHRRVVPSWRSWRFFGVPLGGHTGLMGLNCARRTPPTPRVAWVSCLSRCVSL